ncbi:MAG: T9SS type A sorting domain-containing protein [Chitinophagales bacterium]|nr:T9SS type A sorting domain-containing protein [Chitinophagales bacterium]
MKYILLFLTVLITTLQTTAQNWAWARKAGGTSADFGVSIKKGSGGFIYTCGWVTSPSATFGAHSFSGVVGSRGWIAIQDETNGTYSPPIVPTGTGESAFTSLDVDAQGNAYVTGYFNGTLTFGTKTIQGDQTRSMFIAKMRSDGNWAWAYRLTYSAGPTSQNTGDAVLVSPDGATIFIGGRCHQNANSFLTDADGFSNKFTTDINDGYIAKYDSLGNYQWAVRVKPLGTVQGPATCNNLEFDGQGNVVATGEWTGTVSNMSLQGPLGSTAVSGGITSANSKKAFLARVSATNGAILLGINAFNHPVVTGFFGGVVNGLAVDKTDNRIYLACTQGTTTGALIKYNAAADTVFFYNTNTQIFFNNVTLDSANLPVVCGYMTGSQVTVAGNTYTNAGGNDMFIGRLSKTSGTWDKFQRAGGFQDDYASDVLAVGNTIYMVGSGNSLQTNFDGLTALTNNAVNYDVYTARINLPAPCIAPDITQEPSAVAVCGGQPFSVSVTATGNNITYQWQKGGVNLSGNGSNTATYSIASSVAVDAGNYRCIVSNSCGADTSLVVAVTVNTVNAQISGPTTVCSGLNITLTASGGNSYVWSNSLGTNASVTVSPSTNTTYSVTVTGAGNCTATASQTVSVQTTPTAGISGVSSVCEGNTFTLTATGGNSYAWANGLGSNASITVSPAQTTTYTVTVSNGNCSSTTSKTVTIKLNSASSFAATVCFGESFVFGNQTLTQSGSYNRTESNSVGCDSVITLDLTVLSKIENTINAGICTGQSYTFKGQQLTQAGQYFDTLQTTLGCDSFIMLNLTVNSFVTGSVSQAICQGQSYTFNGQQLTQAGQYLDTLVSVGGCDSIVTLTLTVNALPQPTITQSGNTLSTQSFSSYQWQLNNGNINNATAQNYTATQNGSYTVLVTDANGCSNTSSALNVTIVGIGEIASFRTVIYPNPTTNVINIESEEEIQSIQVADVTGRIIITQSNLATRNLQLATSILAEATYFIHIKTTSGKTAVKSFVKQ